MAERLQKIIARAGITSRRAGEELILAGRVRVNGRIVTELGAKADARDDTIEVDGKRLVTEAARYVVLHKPRNVVSTLHDPEGRPTVAELLSAAGSRLYPVGRLDFATSGVLLATNDGEFTNGLLHPRGGVPKTYVLKVKGLMTEEDLERWATGIELDDGPTLPAEVRKIRHEDDKTWLEITIREGRNQQIRRMGEATGFHVMRLARTSFAGITHEGLRPGEFRSLTVDELEALRKSYGVPKRIRGAVLGDHGEAPARRPRPARPQRERPGRRHDDAAPRARSEQRPGRRRDDAAPHARGEQRPGRRHDDAGPHARGEHRPTRRRDDAPQARGDQRPARRSEDAPQARGDRPAGRHDDTRSRARREAPPRDEARPHARPAARPARPRDATPEGGPRAPRGDRPTKGPARRRGG